MIPLSLTRTNRRRVLGGLLKRVDAYTLWAFNAQPDLSYRPTTGRGDETAT
jgi:hypothetical protein